MPEQTASHPSIIENQPSRILDSKIQAENPTFPYIKNPKTKFFNQDSPETGTSKAYSPNELIKSLKTIPIATKDYTEDLKQIWDGMVIGFNEDTITIRLEDKITPTNPDMVVDLSIEEIPIEDRFLIKEGALLFWYIGYREGNKYPRQRFTKISLRRRLGWTDKEIKDANTIAKEYENFFINDSSQPA